jgi:hypothetical protein
MNGVIEIVRCCQLARDTTKVGQRQRVTSGDILHEIDRGHSRQQVRFEVAERQLGTSTISALIGCFRFE